MGATGIEQAAWVGTGSREWLSFNLAPLTIYSAFCTNNCLLTKPSLALDYYRQSLEVARALEDRDGQATILVNMCFLLCKQGDLESIGPLADQAWHLGEDIGAAGKLTRLCWLAGDLALERGDYEAAGEAYNHAHQYARQFRAEMEQETIERIHQRLAQLEATEGQEAVARFGIRGNDDV